MLIVVPKLNFQKNYFWILIEKECLLKISEKTLINVLGFLNFMNKDLTYRSWEILRLPLQPPSSHHKARGERFAVDT